MLHFFFILPHVNALQFIFDDTSYKRVDLHKCLLGAVTQFCSSAANSGSRLHPQRSVVPSALCSPAALEHTEQIILARRLRSYQ